MGSTKTEKESIKWICDLSFFATYLYLLVLNSAQSSVTIGNL